MVTHSSILAWEIRWTEGPGRLQSMGLQRTELNWATNTFTFFLNYCHRVVYYIPVIIFITRSLYFLTAFTPNKDWDWPCTNDSSYFSYFSSEPEPKFEFWLDHLPVLWPWANYLISLCFSFLIRKKKWVIALTIHDDSMRSCMWNTLEWSEHLLRV